MLLILQVRQMGDLVVRDVEHSEIGVVLESRDLRQGVVRNVEFFKIAKGGEARHFG